MTGYREALANGTATRDGAGVVDGRAVEWLRFADSGNRRTKSAARVERVAVDADTSVPVRVETLGGRQARRRGDDLGRRDARPRERARSPGHALVPPGQEPVVNRVVGQSDVSLDEARAALGGRLVGGASLAGLPRRAVTLKTVAVGYGEDSGREPRRVPSVELSYGAAAGDDGVVVTEALEPLMLYRFGLERQEVPDGSLSVIRFGAGHLGRMQVEGLYVSIEAPGKTLLLDAARTLAGDTP